MVVSTEVEKVDGIPPRATAWRHRMSSIARESSGKCEMAGLSTLRLLVVQHKARSAEAKVVATLLAAMQENMGDGSENRVVIIQFGHADLTGSDPLRAIAGVEVVSFDIHGELGVPQSLGNKIRSTIRFLLTLPRVVAVSRTFGPGVIYSSQQHWDVRVAVVLSAILRRPHVIHLHYVPGPWLRREVLWRLRHCAQVICVSEFIRRKAISVGVSSERTTVLLNVLSSTAQGEAIPRSDARASLCAELGIPASSTLVGMVARLTRWKGQDVLVRAMAPILRDAALNTRLVLAGPEDATESGYARCVLQIAKDEGVAERVHWLGQRSDVPMLLRAFDVFAHPSIDDPCPLAVIEAGLAGLPTVVWDIGGAAEIVVEGETGLLVQNGNVPMLAAALERLCRDKLLRRQMREAAEQAKSRLSDVNETAYRLHNVLESATSRLDS